MREDAPDFVLFLGDYIYEYPGAARAVRHTDGQATASLQQYRDRYALYKSDADLQAMHLACPWFFTWDDHEVQNDYAGLHTGDGEPVVADFPGRRAAAYQAYYEHMPLRAASLPTGPHMRIYRRLQFGNLIDMNVLDTRQWRSDQACGDGSHSDCAEARDPARTMLGAEQERWLFENLGDAKGRWTVIAQQVYSFARDAGQSNPAGRYSMDKWDGYAAARNRLYARLKETRASNPVVLSGDVHVHYGADLKMDFTDPRSEVIGVEFTNTSLSAGGDGADVAANWEAVRSANPHIRYHSARRGYIACTATPSTMRADFKILDHVTTPGAPARIGGALVVEAGKAGGRTV
jgi:alkaline phosphatase D